MYSPPVQWQLVFMDKIFRLLSLCILLNHDFALGDSVVIDIAKVGEAPIFMKISDTHLSPKSVDRATRKFGKSKCSEIAGSFLESRASIALGIWYGNDFFPSSGYFGRGFQTSGIFARWFFMKKPLMEPGLASLMLLPALGAGACLADGDCYGVYICATGFVGITSSYVVPRFAAFEFIELKCRVFEETLHPEFLADAHAKDAIISKDSH